jgi:hypothetical protein
LWIERVIEISGGSTACISTESIKLTMQADMAAMSDTVRSVERKEMISSYCYTISPNQIETGEGFLICRNVLSLEPGCRNT